MRSGSEKRPETEKRLRQFGTLIKSERGQPDGAPRAVLRCPTRTCGSIRSRHFSAIARRLGRREEDRGVRVRSKGGVLSSMTLSCTERLEMMAGAQPHVG